jgi:hypothetical protein
MGEENKTSDAVDAVTGLVKSVPIYDDVVQPAAREVGVALKTVAKTIHIVMAPLTALVWGYERMSEWLTEALAKRLAAVPPEGLQTPNIAVAGPALEALRFAASEPSLRELYANLLATAIAKETASKAHPAFVEILKQLSPDEATLFKRLAEQGTTATPSIDLWADDASRPGAGSLVFRHFNVTTFEVCKSPSDGDSYIDNLSRLGLLDVPRHFTLTDVEAYKPVEEHAFMREAVEQINKHPGRRARLERGVLRLSSFGVNFAEACVLEQDRAGVSKTE